MRPPMSRESAVLLAICAACLAAALLLARCLP